MCYACRQQGTSERHVLFYMSFGTVSCLMWSRYFQPLLLFPATSCPCAFIGKVTAKNKSLGPSAVRHARPGTSRLWHLRLGIWIWRLDASAALQLSLCHPCPLERKCHFDAFKRLGSDMRPVTQYFLLSLTKQLRWYLFKQDESGRWSRAKGIITFIVAGFLFLSFLGVVPKTWSAYGSGFHTALLDPTFHH